MTKTLLTFVHISDTHISPDPTYTAGWTTAPPTQAAARVLVEQINALPFTPDFVLHTGDVIYNPDPSAYGIAQEILGQIRVPVYYVAGNHDDNKGLQAITGRDFPAGVLCETFEINGVQFALVDSNGPETPPRGFMTDSQLAWLTEVCQPDDPRPLVVATHHNPLHAGVPWLRDFMGITNGEALHQALLPLRQRLLGVFFGYVHQNLDFIRNGIHYSSVISPWGQFKAYPGMDDTVPDLMAEAGFSVVTITDQGMMIRRWRYPLPPLLPRDA